MKIKPDVVLWDHQKEIARFMLQRDYGLVAAEMGTGKTLATLAMLSNGMRGANVLIVTTKRGVGVWLDQMDKFVILGETNIIANNDQLIRKQGVELRQVLRKTHEGTILITTYDRVWRDPVYNPIVGWKPDIIILDESHRIKSATAKSSKALHRLGKIARKRFCLTGTPMPNSPLDIFGQARFLNDQLYPHPEGQLLRSFGRFREHFCQLRWLGMPGAYAILGYRNMDEFNVILSEYTYKVEAGKVLSLPATTDNEIIIDLPSKARKVYDTFANELLAEVEGGVMTASNVLVKSLRLHQLCGGFIKKDAEDRATPVHEEKIWAVIDLLEDIDPAEGVVIFCQYTAEIVALADALHRNNWSIAVLSGWKNDLREWQEGNAKVLLVQIEAGGEAIDLTRAHYAIYYSNTYSLGKYQQSRARLHRPGQKFTVHYYHLIARNTIDRVVYKALAAKEDVNNEILRELRGYGRRDRFE